MDSNLEPVYLRITQANRPEDIFGTPIVYSPENQADKVQSRYEKYEKIVNPDIYQDVIDSEYARDAYDQLKNFKAEALEKIAEGKYGISVVSKNQVMKGKSFKIGSRTFYLGNKITTGDMFSFYDGFFDLGDSYFGKVVIKITNDPQYNELIANEVRILEKLRQYDVAQKKHLPIHLNRFTSSGNRDGVVFRKIGGFDFNEIKRQYPDGIDQKHMVWMLDRLLSLMCFIHEVGVVHGRITPSRVMIRTKSHNAFLFNWGTAQCDGAQKRYSHDNFEQQFIAPEYFTAGQIGPWSDIYSIGKLMIWILGGDIQSNSIPREVEPKIRDFLLSLVQEDPVIRPNDAWKLYDQQATIKDSLWPREYLRFDMQAT